MWSSTGRKESRPGEHESYREGSGSQVLRTSEDYINQILTQIHTFTDDPSIVSGKVPLLASRDVQHRQRPSHPYNEESTS